MCFLHKTHRSLLNIYFQILEDPILQKKAAAWVAAAFQIK